MTSFHSSLKPGLYDMLVSMSHIFMLVVHENSIWACGFDCSSAVGAPLRNFSDWRLYLVGFLEL